MEPRCPIYLNFVRHVKITIKMTRSLWRWHCPDMSRTWHGNKLSFRQFRDSYQIYHPCSLNSLTQVLGLRFSFQSHDNTSYDIHTLLYFFLWGCTQCRHWWTVAPGTSRLSNWPETYKYSMTFCSVFVNLRKKCALGCCTISNLNEFNQNSLIA